MIYPETNLNVSAKCISPVNKQNGLISKSNNAVLGARRFPICIPLQYPLSAFTSLFRRSLLQRRIDNDNSRLTKTIIYIITKSIFRILIINISSINIELIDNEIDTVKTPYKYR